MFTVCSKCTLRLSVTPADLRAAQGYVRCSRCHNVFNALAALSEEAPRALDPAPPPAPPDPPAAATTSQAPAVADTNNVDASADAALEFDASATDVSRIFVTAPSIPNTGLFESIILRGNLPEGGSERAQIMHLPIKELAAMAAAARSKAAARREESAPAPPPPEPPEHIDLADPLPEPEAVVTQPYTPEELELADPIPEAPPPQAPAPPEHALPEHTPQNLQLESEPTAQTDAPAAPIEQATPAEAVVETPVEPAVEAAVEPAAEATPETPADPLTAPPAPLPVSRLPSWLPGAACAALALLLVAQMANHWRDSLATGSLRRPVTALYAALGIPLSPHWDVSSYEVRQLGAQTAESGDNLEVRASIHNKARHALPLPLLRITLEDSFGNRIAARDLTPAQYLGGAAASNATLAPDAHVETSTTFVDPGQNAVGFELDACLKLRAGRTVCANDPVRPAQ